jgi:hypothetical protein
VKAVGRAANFLPEVCAVFARAQRAGVLKVTQRNIAHRAGIIAEHLQRSDTTSLVDEATRYRLVGQPVTLSRTPSRMVARPPEFGEQTEEVLKEFGFGTDEIFQAQGRQGGVTASHQSNDKARREAGLCFSLTPSGFQYFATTGVGLKA